jgi:hypothetical protein
MSGIDRDPAAPQSAVVGRIVAVAGVLSLLLVLGGSLATVGLSAAGLGDPSGGCLASDGSGVDWTLHTSLLMAAGVAIAIGTLVLGRRVPFVYRLPAVIAAGCAIPVAIVAAMFAFISYGGAC